MLPEDVVYRTIDALQSGDISTVGLYLSSDFTCKGLSGRTLNKEGYLRVMDSLINAIPNLMYKVNYIATRNNNVRVRTHVVGRNTRPLDLRFLGLPVTPQKGVRVQVSDEIMEFNVKDNKITSLRVCSKAGNTINSVLGQMGTVSRQKVAA